MTKASLIRTATLAALIVLTLLGRSTPVTAADPPRRAIAPTVQIHGDKSAQFIPLGVSKSIVVDLPGDIKDVLVADPLIANAVVRTARRAYIIGVKVGQTNIYFFDAEGKQRRQSTRSQHDAMHGSPLLLHSAAVGNRGEYYFLAAPLPASMSRMPRMARL